MMDRRPAISNTPAIHAVHVLKSALICTALCATLAGAQTVTVGDAIKPISWRDQFEQLVAVNEDTHAVILVSEKSVGEWVNATLGEMPAEALTQRRVVYVSDISAMPTLITKAFALPKWRKLPFSIGLAREAAEVPPWPQQSGSATWMQLRGMQVQSVRYLPNPTQLKLAMTSLGP